MRRALIISAGALLLAACGQGGADNQAAGTGESESNASAGPGAPAQDLASLLAGSPRLVQLVQAAGMMPVLSGKEPYTVLAPNDAALDKLPPAALQGLDQPERKAEVTALLRAHILPGTILASDIARAIESGGGKATVATMAGEPLTITREGQSFRITASGGRSATVVGTEQPARNGVVHQIDMVLAPAS